jgi:KaiC/GvpD/RAD55 family RecA-like ATPase
MQGIFSDPDATSNDFNPILGQDIIVLPYDDPDMKRAIERVSTDIATLVADGPRPDVILFDAPSEGLLPHVGRGERVVELRRLAGETGAVVVLHLKANVSGDDVDVAVLKNADAAWLLHSGGTAACLKAREPKPTVAPPSERIGTGRADVDRDIDGGVERGQTILVAGMPDSGKTEFLLEVAAKNLAAARRVLFVTKNGVADTHARLEAAMFKAVAVPREYQDEARALLLKGWSALFSSDETDFFEVKMALSEKRVDVVIVDDLDVIFDHADGFNGARRGIARVSGLFVEACREHGVVGVASTSIMGSFNGTPSADQDDGKAGPVSTFDVDLMVFKEGPDVCVRALADRRRRVEETPVRDELPQPSSRASAVDEVEPGEIAIAVGLSGFGKTEWLVEVATRFMEKKRFVLFVSMFDKPKAIMKRLDEVSEERGLDEEARAHCLVLSHISFEEMRFEVSTMNSPPDVIIVDGVDVMSRSDYDAGFVAGWCRDLRTTFIASTSDALRQGPWESNATFVVDISDQGFGKVVKSKTGKP